MLERKGLRHRGRRLCGRPHFVRWGQNGWLFLLRGDKIITELLYFIDLSLDKCYSLLKRNRNVSKGAEGILRRLCGFLRLLKGGK